MYEGRAESLGLPLCFSGMKEKDILFPVAVPAIKIDGIEYWQGL